MWQRLTSSSRQVILEAQKEAARLNSDEVKTEHLLIVLMREDWGICAQIFQNQGIAIEQIDALIEPKQLVGTPVTSEEPKLSPGAKRTLEFAAVEALHLKQKFIDREHLLLGLLREENGLASIILRSLGLELEAARAQIQQSQIQQSQIQQSPVSTLPQRPLEHRFTERSRHILGLAQEEAARLNSDLVQMEHLLIGLLRDDGGIGAQLLKKWGVSLEKTRARVEEESHPPEESHLPKATPLAKPPLAPSTRRTLELATQEARLMGHNFVGTEHLLLALLASKHNRVTRLLRIDTEAAHAVALAYFSPRQPATPATIYTPPPVDEDEVQPFVFGLVKAAKDAIKNASVNPVTAAMPALPVETAAVLDEFFTPEVIALIQRAFDNSRGEKLIGIDHLLLALLSEKNAEVLRRKMRGD